MGGSSGSVGRSEVASLEKKIDAANSMELEETALAKVLAKGSSGGEVVSQEDLWNCLFQHRPGHTQSLHRAGREVLQHNGVTAGEGHADGWTV